MRHSVGIGILAIVVVAALAVYSGSYMFSGLFLALSPQTQSEQAEQAQSAENIPSEAKPVAEEPVSEETASPEVTSGPVTGDIISSGGGGSGTGGTTESPPSSESAFADVGFDSATKNGDGSYIIPIRAKFDTELGGVKIDVAFDTSKVEFLDPSLTSLTTDMGLQFGTQTGKQTVGFITDGDNYVSPTTGSIINLNVKPLTSEPDFSSIEITYVEFVDRNANEISMEITDNVVG